MAAAAALLLFMRLRTKTATEQMAGISLGLVSQFITIPCAGKPPEAIRA